MNTKLIPFDLDKAKNGAKVVTRNGYPVRIGFFELKGEHSFPVVGAVCIDGQEKVNLFTPEGKDSELDESDLDLFIEEEEEEKPRREYIGTDSIYVPKDDDGIREELIDAINGLWDNDALPMPLSMKRKDAWLAWLQKQGVEKPADNKPKFQKGNWVIDKQGTVHQIANIIENVTNNTYGYDVVGGGYFNENVEGIRFWTIQDARNGVVLACDTCIVLFKEIDGLNIKCHCTYHFMDTPMFFVDTLQNKTAFYPATKEQRDLLFKKMKEEGYEWDSDKKELKKVVADTVEKKIKTRRMTQQEFSWWLRDCPEEHREYMVKGGHTAYTADYNYPIDEANEEIGEVYIRRNGGEWMEPLIED